MLNLSDYLRVMNCSFHSCERQKEVGSLFAWFTLQVTLQEECSFSWLSWHSYINQDCKQGRSIIKPSISGTWKLMVDSVSGAILSKSSCLLVFSFSSCKNSPQTWTCFLSGRCTGRVFLVSQH